MNNDIQRITYKRARPNPLFQEWLEELHEEAKQKRSKLEPMLNKALESLSKYPLPLQSGAECGILKGFKKQLCKFLDRRLEVHRRNVDLQANIDLGFQNIQSESGLPDFGVHLPRRNIDYRRTRVTSTVTSGSLEACENPHASSFVDLHSGVGTTGTSNLNPLCNINNNIYQMPIDEQLQNNTPDCDNQSVPNTSDILPYEHCGTPPLSLIKNIFTIKPKQGSIAYAILLVILEHTKDKSAKFNLTEEELISKIQRYCYEPFTNENMECFYAACTNLELRGLLLTKSNNETVYHLTYDGIHLANELLKESRESGPMNTITGIESKVVPSTSYKEFSGNNIENYKWIPEMVEMPAGSYDVVLLIDKNENRVPTCGSSSRKALFSNIAAFQNSERRQNILDANFTIKFIYCRASRRNESTVQLFRKYFDLIYEYRSLKVGDFIWVARHRERKNYELVLPYIVERKRMDDLASSIKDGRFHEQKFRLRKCGLDHIIYLVESYGSNTHVGLPMQTLRQALDNTRAQDKFKIHFTNSLADSVKFLAMITKRLTMRYQEKNLRGSNYESNGEDLKTFPFFNKSSSKTKPLSVSDTFVKMLLQLKGLSVEKAIAITDKYKTPRNLIEAYRQCNERECYFLLANLKYGEFNQKVGPMISNKVYLLFAATSPI